MRLVVSGSSLRGNLNLSQLLQVVPLGDVRVLDGAKMLFRGFIHNEWQSIVPLVFEFVCVNECVKHSSQNVKLFLQGFFLNLILFCVFNHKKPYFIPK